MTKKKSVDIPNWSYFGTKSVSIEIMKFSVDGMTVYAAGLGIFLDPGKKTDEELHISFGTDVQGECLDCVLRETLESLSGLYPEINSIVFVVDADTGDVLQEIDLNKWSWHDEGDDEEDDEIETTLEGAPKGVAIH